MPILSAAILLPLSRVVPSETIWLFVMSFAAVGHHLPGFIRTYGNRDLFTRYRARFLLAPPLFFAACLGFSFYDLHGMIVFQFVWSAWHGMMQHYGFVRIYDAKLGQTSKHWANLDFALALSGFFCVLLWSPVQGAALFDGLLQSGMPVPSESVMQALRQLGLAAVAVIVALYIGAFVNAKRRGETISPFKWMLISSTMALVVFARITTSDPALSVALFEVLHDVQYLAIVWGFNHTLLSRGIEQSRLTRILFTSNATAIALYIVLCLAYGSIGFVTEVFMPPGTIQKVLVALLTTSGLLHFYYDGFIWQVRRVDTQQGLALARPENEAAKGMTNVAATKVTSKKPKRSKKVHTPPQTPLPRDTSSPLDSSVLKNALHPVRYTLPLGALLLLESHQPRRDEFALATDMVRLWPASATAQNNLGVELLAAQRAEQAREHLEQAVRLAPDMADARNNLGESLLRLQRASEALPHLREAVRLKAGLTTAWVNLGDALRATQDVPGALSAYAEAIRLGADTPRLHMSYGSTLVAAGRKSEAIAQFERALFLRPELAPAHVALAKLLAEKDDLRGALDHMQSAHRIVPEALDVMTDVAGLLMHLNRYDEAEQTLRRVLEKKPDFGPARAYLDTIARRRETSRP